MKYAVYLVVLIGCSLVRAGSYEDFFVAVRNDDGNAIRTLIRQGFDANVRDPKGEHALHLAARDNAGKAVAALLQWDKLDVEPRNKVDESPLMLACLAGQLEMAQQLVERGADVNKPGWAPLHYAATRGHVAVMRFLLERNAYIDAASPNGTTPLMMAAYYGTPSAVKLLLESGADPLLKNQQDLSAIDFAHRANRADSAEIIAAFVRAR
ncbi:MAG: ankyrin repeat domain-containing protein, partial [Rhodoferax sp.]|nr:ankyrin repeat domain-containing protein [Rhodoferax sp.]